ncbi:hypothetical protein GDO81_014658 [Engystomops pustulosus]|uniref:Uncharacterized protein n=1 Tax=Engystomops pustulosus TaxID=76066 RepID=A0AAV7BBS4_ENGPU|nr:hypothetical protein GDO81_014658 [Engystomops pustulosus]
MSIHYGLVLQVFSCYVEYLVAVSTICWFCHHLTFCCVGCFSISQIILTQLSVYHMTNNVRILHPAQWSGDSCATRCGINPEY